MNHRFLDILSHRLSDFAATSDPFTYGPSIRKLSALIGRLYEGDGDDSSDMLSVSAWLNDERRFVRLVDEGGRYIGWNRLDLCGVVSGAEGDYWYRVRPEWPNGMRHTGRKRNYRKHRTPRLSKDDYRPYKGTLSYCWKDQSKRKRQYKPIDMVA